MAPDRLFGLILAVIFSMTPSVSVAGEKLLRVSDFGARPNDGKDDSAAIQAALSRGCKEPGSVIRFSAGIYDVSRMLLVNRARDMTLACSGTVFVLHEPVTLLDVSNTSGFRAGGLSVQYIPAPSFLVRIAGRVSESELRVHSRVAYSGPVEGLLGMDLASRRPSGRDLYMREKPAQSKAASPGTLEISGLRKGFLPPVGSWTAVRQKIYGPPVIRFAHCRDIALGAIQVSSGPGMGMLFLYCEDIRLRKIRVTPLSRSRALSTNADATHFNSCRGAIVFDGCTFERMGDDAINIHGTYLRLKDVLSPKSIRVVTGRRDVDWMPVSPRAGDQISIHSPQNPFGDPLFLGIVVSTKSEPSTRSAEVSFQGGVPQELPEDAVVWNRSASPRLTVRNCTFLNNRARGILVQCGNALIEHNWFEGMSGSAINVTCDVGTWWESGPTENVTIRNNMIAHCNDGAGASAGAISVFADAPGIPPQRGVHRRVRIENNSIRQVLRAGISISSSADVIISGNAIREVFGPGVLVRSSTDVKISNNRFEEVTENVAHE